MVEVEKAADIETRDTLERSALLLALRGSGDDDGAGKRAT